jgi:hypothetical protein
MTIIKPFKFLTVEELSQAVIAEGPKEWLVEGVIPTGTINVIVAKAKTGKSTVVRQLISCLIQGHDFLGRTTTKCEALYFAPEESKEDVENHYKMLGVSKGAYTITRQGGGYGSFGNFNERLVATLQMLPDVRLLVLDPLIDFMPSGTEIHDYGQVSKALRELNEIANPVNENGELIEGRKNIAILLLHHSKKRVGDSVGDSVLGSTAITAAMHTIIYMDGEFDDVRMIQSSQRDNSRRIPKTNLVWDAATQSYNLGEPVKPQREQKAKNTRDIYKSQILQLTSASPGIDQSTLIKLLGCSKPTLLPLLADLEFEGRIKREGDGKKGSPKTYHPIDDSDSGWGGEVVSISAEAA